MPTTAHVDLTPPAVAEQHHQHASAYSHAEQWQRAYETAQLIAEPAYSRSNLRADAQITYDLVLNSDHAGRVGHDRYGPTLVVGGWYGSGRRYDTGGDPYRSIVEGRDLAKDAAYSGGNVGVGMPER